MTPQELLTTGWALHPVSKTVKYRDILVPESDLHLSPDYNTAAENAVNYLRKMGQDPTFERNRMVVIGPVVNNGLWVEVRRAFRLKTPVFSIPDAEDQAFLLDLANTVTYQENRGTSHPFYFCVRKQKRLVGMDASISTDTVFVESDSGDYQEYPTREEAEKRIREEMEGCSEERIQSALDSIEEYGVHTYDEDENFFLTYRGFKQHMRLNAHNYPGKQDGEKFKESDVCYSYVKHAFRNPEILNLMSIILKFADIAEVRL